MLAPISRRTAFRSFGALFGMPHRAVRRKAAAEDASGGAVCREVRLYGERGR